MSSMSIETNYGTSIQGRQRVRITVATVAEVNIDGAILFKRSRVHTIVVQSIGDPRSVGRVGKSGAVRLPYYPSAYRDKY